MSRSDLLERIINKFKASPVDEYIYLVLKTSEEAGFFSNNGNLLFAERNLESLEFQDTETEYISLRTNVNIYTVANEPQFPNGSYNILTFKDDSDGTLFETFIRLCLTYNNSDINYGFIKFFYSLVDLFQIPEEQDSRRLIGLTGELLFIDYVYTNFNFDLSLKWHSKTNDKYDFVCSKNNFEIKTTTSEESIVIIKHKQIFNNDNNYLVLIKIQNNNSGMSFNEFVDSLRNREPFIRNYQFQLSVEHAIKNVSIEEGGGLKFTLVSLEAYNVSELYSIQSIPSCISDLTYKYDFSGMTPSTLNRVLFS